MHFNVSLLILWVFINYFTNLFTCIIEIDFYLKLSLTRVNISAICFSLFLKENVISRAAKGTKEHGVDATKVRRLKRKGLMNFWLGLTLGFLQPALRLVTLSTGCSQDTAPQSFLRNFSL